MFYSLSLVLLLNIHNIDALRDMIEDNIVIIYVVKIYLKMPFRSSSVT